MHVYFSLMNTCTCIFFTYEYMYMYIHSTVDATLEQLQ